MSKKKKMKKNQSSSGKPEVKLSQCMIVKNEEKNIETALNWAKPVAYEQIVVDTGSTDRTVEIAEKMGAKVYHFDWINDFSAAKNYAIKQATGDWIAFLDADEYFSPEDTAKLIEKLNVLGVSTGSSNETTILQMPWHQLNDAGEVIVIDVQNRVFRNIKEVYYVGRIHEYLHGRGEIKFIDDTAIIHTGYAETELKERGKAARNVELLRMELKERPNDMMMKAYLADSLNSVNALNDYSNQDDVAEVDSVFREVIESDAMIPEYLRKKAFEHVLREVWNDPDKVSDCVALCEKAIKAFPHNLDFYYYCSVKLNEAEKYEQAWELLHDLDSKIDKVSGSKSGMSDGTASTSAAIASDPLGIYGQTLIAAQGLGDVENTIKYAEIILKENKSLNNILSPYIHILLNTGLAPDEVFEKLAEIYDITSLNDMLFIARSAKDCGAIEFARMLMTIAGEMQ